MLSYLNRRDAGDMGTSYTQGLLATLVARANVPVWQPWFGKLSGEVEFGAIRNDTQDVNGVNVNSENSNKQGNARLAMFPLSNFPFEAHIARNDSRNSGNLSALDGYISRNVGFSQNLQWSSGNVMLGFDSNSQNRTTQTINTQNGGEYRQNNMKLGLAQTFGPEQALSLNGTSARNTQENSDQLSRQTNLSARHNFRQGTELTVETMADTTRAHNLLQLPNQVLADSDVRQSQLNSHTIWKPADDPLTVNGGVRLMTVTNRYDVPGAGGIGPVDTSSAEMKSVNLNCGAAYDFSKAFQLTGSANISLSSNDSMQNSTQSSTQNTASSESLGANYRADSFDVGNFQYAWFGGGTFANHNSDAGAIQQLHGQLSHQLNRSTQVSQGSTVSSQASQSVSSSWGNRDDPSQQLTHSALLAWNATQDGGSTTLLQLNASDTRSWGANPGLFQLINFQATGSLATGRYSTWSGGLTIQTSRQNYGIVAYSSLPNSASDAGDRNKFITTSSGSLSYRNQRLFDVERLQFTSDLRLNSQSFLPMLGAPSDNESAAWENHLEYAIGRVLLRLDARAAKNGSDVIKSYLFTLTRNFGDI